jgi:hypothetical protein
VRLCSRRRDESLDYAHEFPVCGGDVAKCAYNLRIVRFCSRLIGFIRAMWEMFRSVIVLVAHLLERLQRKSRQGGKFPIVSRMPTMSWADAVQMLLTQADITSAFEPKAT